MSPAQQTPDTLAVPLLGLAVMATQLGPASRTGLDSARLGVPVGPRAAAHAALGLDAHVRPKPPQAWISAPQPRSLDESEL